MEKNARAFPPEADPACPTGGPMPPWREGLAPRRRFRARLERDPRRWVLFLVAMDGLVAPLLNLSDKRDLFLSRGFGPVVLIAITATLPATAVLVMLVHGRLLFWTGKLLHGSARPHEIHAAFAWSQAPLVAVGWPLLLEAPLRAVAADLLVVPGWLGASIRFAELVREPVEDVAAAAAVVGVVLWVKYLAEAQRFSSWRAIANMLMAGALLVGVCAGSFELAMAVVPGGNRIVQVAVGSATIPLAVGAIVLIGRARSGGGRPGRS